MLSGSGCAGDGWRKWLGSGAYAGLSVCSKSDIMHSILEWCLMCDPTKVDSAESDASLAV